MRNPLIRTLIAGAAVLAVAAVGASAAHAADPDQTVIGSTSGGMGEVACDPQAPGNDGDPTKAGGYGKVQGDSWGPEGSVPGLVWTISGGTINIAFDDTFVATDYPISEILVKGGDGYVVCHAQYYFEADDSLTLSTETIGLSNGKNAPDISHVSFYPGEAQWRPSEEPVCTTEDLGTVALATGADVSQPGKNWFGVLAVDGTVQTEVLYAGQHNRVGTVTVQPGNDGKMLVTYTLDEGMGYSVTDVQYSTGADVKSMMNKGGNLVPGIGNGATKVDLGETSFEIDAAKYFFIHMQVEKETCTVG